MFVIPTKAGVPYYSMRTSLDGRDFNLRFAWNQREERWYMDIRSDIDEPLALGLKLVTNVSLLRAMAFDPRLPPGLLMAMDMTLDQSPPGYYDLEIGKRVQLVYDPTTDF